MDAPALVRLLFNTGAGGSSWRRGPSVVESSVVIVVIVEVVAEMGEFGWELFLAGEADRDFLAVVVAAWAAVVGGRWPVMATRPW